ncbi:hypothetical protein J0A67_01840 [Algoriphagus aestuariicola]|uniref:DUF6603 domain-containing protein n=1 Tax=Algoriphagus aestuariicola TaxID=1852016 RepID=A0ABS3BKK9_9BACT|nr:DUF6603 domain-containing protein [Algoriphagus aestuariicola]MBN7799580.1 hypothetical protein [Algoriphagus aestuariicola]
MAEDDSQDFFQKVLKLFYEIIKPGLDIFSDDQARNELLGSLGLPPSGSAPNIPIGTSLEEYVNKADDEVQPFKLAGAIADMTAIVVAIEGIVQAAIAASGGDEKRTANEIVTAILNLLTLEYLRRRMPAVHSVISLLNALDTKMAAAGGSSNFIVDDIGGFLKSLGKGLEDEDSADALSDSLFMGIAGGLFLLDHFLRKGGVEDLTIGSNYGYEGVESSTTPIADRISNRTFTYGVDATIAGEVPLKLYNTLLFAPKSHGGVAFVTKLLGRSARTFNIGEGDRHSVGYDVTGDALFRIGTLPEAKGGPANKFIVFYSYNTPNPTKIALLDKPVIKFAFGTVKLGVMVQPDDLLVKGILNIHYEVGKGGLTGFPFSLIPDLNDKFPLGIGYSLKHGFIVDGNGNIGIDEKKKSDSGSGGDSAAASTPAGDSSSTPAASGGDAEPLAKILTTLLNALNMRLPIHKNLGDIVGLEVLTIKVNVSEDMNTIELEVSLDFWLKFGPPVTLTINRLGLNLQAKKLEGNGGVFGYDLVPAIKWPTGAGIRINAGVVTGGGFLYLDPDKGEYFGALELSFKNLFDLKAVGIINTKMPDGTEGFSLLIIITAEFSPVQLGFGFTLIGVGGLLGINRRAEVEALRVGLKTNALKSILFPEDVVGNISRIISDIKQIFPIKEDSFLIGLMGKIGWGTPTLISVEIGIILELPEPKIIIIGVVKMALPTEETALVKIQVNFLGVIDFQNGFVYFEARLFDSKLVGFPLTGSLALVVAWGGSDAFGLSIGGFHPDFKDYPTVPTLPGAFRDMDRISLQLLSGDNPRLSVECYLAVTSNSVQFGAKIELLVEGPMSFNLYGALALDVLFIFDPFSFIVRLEATLAIRQGTSVLFGIHFIGRLSGPTPWNISGEVSFGLLFITITISFDETWGDPKPDVEIETEDLRALLTAELQKSANWRPIIPENNHLHVSLRAIPEDQQVDLLIQPFGSITFSQRTLPLNMDIKKYGNRKPLKADEANFKISRVNIGESAPDFAPAKELFAIGNYQPLSEDEKLSRKSFEQLESGITINDTGELRLAKDELDSVTLDYELDYTYDDDLVPPRRFMKIPLGGFKHLARGAGVASSKLAWKNEASKNLNAPEKVVLRTTGFTIASTDDLKELNPSFRAESYAEALETLQKESEKNKTIKANYQIVGMHELV